MYQSTPTHKTHTQCSLWMIRLWIYTCSPHILKNILDPIHCIMFSLPARKCVCALEYRRLNTPQRVFPSQKKREFCLALDLMSYQFVIVSFQFHYWATRMNWQRKQSTHDAPTETSNMKCWLLLSTQPITKGTQRVSDSQNKPHDSMDHILHSC